MTSTLAPIWISRCQASRIASSAKGSITTNIASTCPAARYKSAANSARARLSISPLETASGHPIAGLTP